MPIMTHSYMVLTLGRDLAYIGGKISENSFDTVKKALSAHSGIMDEDDSIIFYSVHESGITAITAGIATGEPGSAAGIPPIDYTDPPAAPGTFSLPPGKYGFIQLESNADHVIAEERAGLLDYLAEKGLTGNPSSFFLRILNEDNREVYQILIPLV